MKYSLSNRQPNNVLENADEIYLYYRDFGIFTKLIETYPNKSFLIILRETDKVPIADWEFLQICKNRVKLEIECTTMEHFSMCKFHEIPFCLYKPMESFYELRNWMSLGATSFYIGPTLFFDMEELLKINIKIRLIPNTPGNNEIRPKGGNYMSAPWIRPEDIELYAGSENICRFFTDVEDYLKQEQALFNIYQNGHWPGKLGDIIRGLGSDCRSAALLDDFGKKRLSCHNRCQIDPNYCHFCQSCEHFGQLITKKFQFEEEN